MKATTVWVIQQSYQLGSGYWDGEHVRWVHNVHEATFFDSLKDAEPYAHLNGLEGYRIKSVVILEND